MRKNITDGQSRTRHLQNECYRESLSLLASSPTGSTQRHEPLSICSDSIPQFGLLIGCPADPGGIPPWPMLVGATASSFCWSQELNSTHEYYYYSLVVLIIP